MKLWVTTLLAGGALVLTLPASTAPAADSGPTSLETAYQQDLSSQTATKYLLVVGTLRSYRGAELAATRLVEKTGLKLEREPLELYRGQPTYARDVCELNGWDYPCYVARGRFDDGAYLSVEPSSEYPGMRPGFFVVIAASGSRSDVLAEQEELRRRGVPSYVARSEVWLGCIH